MKKYVYVTLLLVVAAVALFASLRFVHKDKPEPPGERERVAIAVESSRRRDMADVRVFTGNLKANSSFDLATKVPGRLETLTVTTGNPIEPGRMVAKIDDVEYRQQLEQARANLEVGRAQTAAAKIALDQAEREYARYQSMHDSKVCSDAQFEQAEATRNSAAATLAMRTADVERLSAILDNAQTKLADTTIAANWQQGVRYVGKRFVDPGALLAANSPIVTVIDISFLKAEINVIERDYPKLKLGDDAAIITDAYPGESFSGKVYTIAQNLDAGTRQAPVTVKIPNADGRLKPGMFVRVSIEFARHPNATVIPRAALAERNGQQGVFIYLRSEGAVHFLPVTTGFADGDDIEVVSPNIIFPVATVGVHQLTDGASVFAPIENDSKK